MSIWRCSLLIAAVLLSSAVPAQEIYPARPVRLLVGVAHGSTADISLRLLAQKFSQILGGQFVVENRTGAGSNLAADFVAHAPKDGHTLLFGTAAIRATGSRSLAKSKVRLGDSVAFTVLAEPPYISV